MDEIIFMCYRSALGTLKILPYGYSYTSNIEAEQIMKGKGHIHSLNYTLFNSYERVSTKLFDEFIGVLKQYRRDDIKKRAGILDDDSINEQLCKFAKLRMHPSEFYFATPDNLAEYSI